VDFPIFNVLKSAKATQHRLAGHKAALFELLVNEKLVNEEEAWRIFLPEFFGACDSGGGGVGKVVPLSFYNRGRSENSENLNSGSENAATAPSAFLTEITSAPLQLLPAIPSAKLPLDKFPPIWRPDRLYRERIRVRFAWDPRGRSQDSEAARKAARGKLGRQYLGALTGDLSLEKKKAKRRRERGDGR
jgi:hypothetical protein